MSKGGKESTNNDQCTYASTPTEVSVEQRSQTHEFTVQANPVVSCPSDSSMVGFRELTGRDFICSIATSDDYADPHNVPGPSTEVTVDHSLLKELILDKQMTARVAPILLMSAGLPNCGKSDLLHRALARFVRTRDNPMKSVKNQDKLAGLDYYEFAAIRLPKPYDKMRYFETNTETFSLYAFESCLKTHFSSRMQRVVKFHEPENRLASIKIFDDQELDKHFLDVFSSEAKIYNGVSLSEPEKVSQWDMSLSGGIALINAWDFGINKSVFHFLVALCGHLYNSYMWSFFDLQRDVPHLDEIPDVPDNTDDSERADKSTFMRIRPRLEYLVRSAKLTASRMAAHRSTNACSFFAVCRDEITPAEIKTLKGIFEKRVPLALKEAGVANLVAKRNLTIFLEPELELSLKPDNHHVFYHDTFLKEELDVIVRKQLHSSLQIPLSCVFLRSMFYKLDKLYITKHELQQKAAKLHISDDMLENDFCEVYTSAGSIFDMSLVNHNLNYVIVKPMKFLRLLDNIFYPSPTKYPNVVHHGLVTEKDAVQMFGENVNFFMDVLCSVNLATKINAKSVQQKSNLSERGYYYFIPHARTKAPVATQNAAAIRLIHLSPDGNHQFQFTQTFLKNVPNAKLSIQEPSPVNATSFIMPSNNGVETAFSVVHIKNEIEFHLSDNVDKIICQAIIKSCYEIFASMTFKYKFAIICSSVAEDGSATYHSLPLLSDCRKCKASSNSLYCSRNVDLWNSILSQPEYTIPKERVLNGDHLTIDDAYQIVKKMDHLSTEGCEKLARKLEVSTSFKSSTSGWRSLYAMIFQWEIQQEDCSKAQLAKVLEATAADPELLDQNDSQLLKNTANYMHSIDISD